VAGWGAWLQWVLFPLLPAGCRGVTLSSRSAQQSIDKNPISAGTVGKVVRDLMSCKVSVNIPESSYFIFYFFSILEI